MKLPQIEPQTFYLVGKFAFFTIALLGLVGVVDRWGDLKSYEIFSALASSIFYFVLSGFFAKLQKDNEVVEVNDGDVIEMNKALEQLNLGKSNAKKK